MKRLSSSIVVLYEDSDVVAIAKPSGISVHHDGKKDEEVITDWLVKKYPGIKDVGEPLILNNGVEVSRPGIVHRLDKGTSGVLIVAKTTEAYEYLKSQFQNREVKKTYNAFLHGKLRDERGVVDRPIGRAEGSIRKWATGSKARGELRDAITRYKVIKSAQGASYVELWPKTGRTHQIRVHMQSIGHPVIADKLYAPTRPLLLGFKRLALHASKLVFKDLSGNEVEVVAPMPKDFETALKDMGILKH